MASVHHQTDRKHQTKQRKRVDGKTEHTEKTRTADQRDRTASSGISVARQFLQEEVDHEDHEREGNQKRYDDSFMPSVTARVVSSATT